jgi:5'(3')-deoxyribonucleotidase
VADRNGGFVFAVDLDGVCADHTGAFRAIVAADRGIEPERLPLERSWSFVEWDFADGDFERYHRLAVMERRMFRTMPVIDGCAEALWRLSDAGVWIRVVTHRLYVNWGHAVAAADTVEWLDEARIPYRDLCFLGAKAEVQADLYVDDAPHNVEALRAAGNEVIVFDQPYNRGLPGPRATTWAEVEEIVHEVAARRGVSIAPQLPGFDAGSDRLERRRNGGGDTRPEGASI